jgi:D-alanyl-D-alanine carboxypeptidase
MTISVDADRAAGGDAALAKALPGIRERIEEQFERSGLPGAAVGVVRDQALVWSEGFGLADVERGLPPDEHTIYRVGSITKTFTATAIVQLRDEGRLRLDDPLVLHIPEFAAAQNPFGPIEDVTLKRLLTHHSGLMGEPPLPHWETLLFPTIEEIIASLPRVRVSIEPDSAFKYSNLAYSLLGEVVARVAGVPYVEDVHARILGPLGMAESAFSLTEALRPRMATGYSYSAFSDVSDPAPHPLISGMTSAGQLYSTVADLARWIALQFRTDAPGRDAGGVLAGRSLREMHRPVYLEANWTVGHCLGWRAMRSGENVYLGHGGGIHGFITQILFNQERKLGAIALTNGVGPAAEIALEVMERVVAEDAKAPKRSARTAGAIPAAWRAYLGYYVSPLGGPPIQVEYRNGELLLISPPAASGPALPPTRLAPTEEPHIFTVLNNRYAGEPLTFRVAADGTVTGFVASGFASTRLLEATALGTAPAPPSADELIHAFATQVADPSGRVYAVQARGGPRADGLWEGWLTFTAADGAMLRTGRETTQSSRDALAYWAAGLEPVYLDGARARARPVS